MADAPLLKISIDGVVFDLGGVLIDWDPRHLYRKLFSGDEAAMEDFLATVIDAAWNVQQDAGRPFADAVAEASARHPRHAALIEAFPSRWEEMLAGPIDGSVTLLDGLRRRGVPLYALTNWSRETFPIARARFDFLDWFQGIVVSGEERIAKPNPAIFHRLTERYGLAPSATLFIDDAEKNVDAARNLGFQDRHFRSPMTLRADLGEYGLL